jgi:urease accessory protein
MRRALSLARLALPSLLVGEAAPVAAHPGHDMSGFLHPLTGADHLLAMVGVGLWASLLAVRKPAAAWLVPASFLVMVGAGAAAGFAGIKLPLVEAVISASVVAIGILIMAAVRLPAVAAMALVGLFALYHGYAHALQAPKDDTGGYILGFLVATSLLQALGLGLGMVARRSWGDLGLRALGGALMAVGALVLMTN